MSERYVKVFGCEDNLYSDNAPVIVRAGALHKDTESGRMIAQLKLQNVSGKMISYVKLSITSLDATKNQIGDPFDVEYLDLSAPDFEVFGIKNAIVLPNASARAFLIGVKSVAFADGTVWSGEDMNWTHVDDTAPVMVRITTEEIYNKAFTLSQEKNEADIKKAIELFKSIEANKSVSADIERCNQKLDELVADADKAKKKKKKRKKVVLIIVAVILAIALGLLSYYVLIPYAVWGHADKLVSEDKYVEAFEYVYDAENAGVLSYMSSYYFDKAVSHYIVSGEIDEAIDLMRQYPNFAEYVYLEYDVDQYLEGLVNVGEYEKAFSDARKMTQIGLADIDTSVYYMACIKASVEVGDVDGAINLFKQYDSEYNKTYYNATKVVKDGKLKQSIFNDVLEWMNSSDFIGVSESQRDRMLDCAGYILSHLDSDYGTDTYYLEKFCSKPDYYEQLWEYQAVRKIIKTTCITEFLCGAWYTDSDDYYFKMSEYSGHTISYNLPIPDKSGADYYSIRDLVLGFYSSSDDKICDAFRFELDDNDPNVIKIYCFQDEQTYTLYRQE